jgi:hypothetical protein
MTNQIHLYLIETNPERAKSLGAELEWLPQVSAFQKYADAVEASGGLDAVFVPLMSAVEWGVIKPPVPLHQTQVVKMPDHEIARGRPHYAIPGVATSPDESTNPVDTTRLVLRESFKAIRQFNETSPTKLKKVGVVALSLGLEKLRAGEAMELLSDAYLSPIS